MPHVIDATLRRARDNTCVASAPGAAPGPSAPSVRPGSVSTHVSYFPDMLPTFAELLNIKLTSQTDGISLLPTLLQKGEQKQHEFLFWSNAIRKGKWKYVTGGREFTGKRGQGQLFELESDPGEQRDLAEKHPEIVAEMKKIYQENKIKSTRGKRKK